MVSFDADDSASRRALMASFLRWWTCDGLARRYAVFCSKTLDTGDDLVGRAGCAALSGLHVTNDRLAATDLGSDLRLSQPGSP